MKEQWFAAAYLDRTPETLAAAYLAADTIEEQQQILEWEQCSSTR